VTGIDVTKGLNTVRVIGEMQTAKSTARPRRSALPASSSGRRSRSGVLPISAAGFAARARLFFRNVGKNPRRRQSRLVGVGAARAARGDRARAGSRGASVRGGDRRPNLVLWRTRRLRAGRRPQLNPHRVKSVPVIAEDWRDLPSDSALERTASKRLCSPTVWARSAGPSATVNEKTGAVLEHSGDAAWPRWSGASNSSSWWPPLASESPAQLHRERRNDPTEPCNCRFNRVPA